MNWGEEILILYVWLNMVILDTVLLEIAAIFMYLAKLTTWILS
jgi:hypothetical protein